MNFLASEWREWDENKKWATCVAALGQSATGFKTLKLEAKAWRIDENRRIG